MSFGNVPRAIGASWIKDVDVITPAEGLQTGWQIPFFIGMPARIRAGFSAEVFNSSLVQRMLNLRNQYSRSTFVCTTCFQRASDLLGVPFSEFFPIRVKPLCDRSSFDFLAICKLRERSIRKNFAHRISITLWNMCLLSCEHFSSNWIEGLWVEIKLSTELKLGHQCLE